MFVINRRTEIIHKERKKELLEKCFDILAEKGLENTGMRDLCKACGLSTNNSLYHYFGNKETIVVESVVVGLKRIENDFVLLALEHKNSLEKFSEDISLLIEKYKKDFGLIYQVATSPFYGEKVRPYLKILSEKYDDYVEQIATQRSCDSKQLRPLIYLLFSVISGFMLFGDMNFSRVQFEYIYEQLVNIS